MEAALVVVAAALAVAVLALASQGKRNDFKNMARIAHAKALADICAAAGLPDVAADYATKNTDLETARAQLIAAKSEDGPEIVTAHLQGKPTGVGKTRAETVYERRAGRT